LALIGTFICQKEALGGIGLNLIQGARLAGAGQIIGIGINPDREA
jgi:S-(hydroxymethyl)glutathione dehydrogenase/alcohol dehydrogenase